MKLVNDVAVLKFFFEVAERVFTPHQLLRPKCVGLEYVVQNLGEFIPVNLKEHAEPASPFRQRVLVLRGSALILVEMERQHGWPIRRG